MIMDRGPSWLDQRAPRDYKELRAVLKANGYEIVNAGGKHWRLLRPNGTFVMSWALSPSDREGILLTWTQLRKREGRGG